jgi:hypothetical protein
MLASLLLWSANRGVLAEVLFFPSMAVKDDEEHCPN